MTLFHLEQCLSQALRSSLSEAEVVNRLISTTATYIVRAVVKGTNQVLMPPREADIEHRIRREVEDHFKIGTTDAQLIRYLQDLAVEWVSKITIETMHAPQPLVTVVSSAVDEEHHKLQAQTCKPGDAIALTSLSAHLVHMALGVAGEAGELVDAIKKQAIYCKQVDIANIIEELGDLEWYMQGIRAALCISREEVLVANITKLRKRYSTGSYSNEQAQQRKDKEPSTNVPITYESNDE